jgi:beta-lactamase class A
MTHSANRRALVLAAAVAPFALAFEARSTQANPSKTPRRELATLEKRSGGRLGVFALDTAIGANIRYRADERFPFCSTYKVVLASAVLARSVEVASFMDQRIKYDRGDIVAYSPVTEQHIAVGMTTTELCRAAVELSDNTATNLLVKMLGGPSAVTAFARSIGDKTFRLDRWEPQLNTAIPGDSRDTSTPAAMARTLQAVALGSALPSSQRESLQTWLRNCRTGAKRIRAAVTAGWEVGDKTGTGEYGTANDIAVIWPPSRSQSSWPSITRRETPWQSHATMSLRPPRASPSTALHGAPWRRVATMGRCIGWLRWLAQRHVESQHPSTHFGRRMRTYARRRSLIERIGSRCLIRLGMPPSHGTVPIGVLCASQWVMSQAVRPRC